MMKWGQKRVPRSPRRYLTDGDSVFRGVSISAEDREIYSWHESRRVSGFDADDDITAGRTKKFSSVDEMLPVLKSPW